MAVKSAERVVIVTGAGGGLGRTYALHLARRGMRVLVNNRHSRVDARGRSSAERVVEEIIALGGDAVANHEDARDPASGERMVSQALDTWGRLDALVANAGVDQHAPFHRIGLAEFQEVFEINFQGSLWVTHAAWTHMRAAGHGRVVLSTSAAGLHGLHGLTAYSASKAALIGLMRALAGEGASRDVHCNAVAPFARSRMTEAHGDAAVLAGLDPEHVAPLVELLVSAESRVNGQTIVAGGGRFRRAAMVEGHGIAYADAERVTAEALQRDWQTLADLTGAREFPDALVSFADFLQDEGAARGD